MFLWLLLFFQRREQSAYQLVIRRQMQKMDEQNLSLAEANALKLKMFSVVAHDLRTPMTSLLVILENIEEGLIRGEAAASIVRGVAEQQRGIHFMLENILE
jgi:K+-sensing histidine kinase KdpD